LVTAIALGEYLPGERLPSERDLAALIGVSRSTIREASGRLLAAGLVDVRRGRQGGIYVRARWTATHNPQIAGLSHELLTKVSLGLPIEPFDSDSEVCARALREHTQMCEAIEA